MSELLKEQRFALYLSGFGFGAMVTAMALPLAYPSVPVFVWQIIFWFGVVIMFSSIAFLFYDMRIRPRYIRETTNINDRKLLLKELYDELDNIAKDKWKSYNYQLIGSAIKLLTEWKDKARRLIYNLFGQEELNAFDNTIKYIKENDEYRNPAIGMIEAFYNEKETYIRYLEDFISMLEKNPELWIKRWKGLSPWAFITLIGTLLICGIIVAMYQAYKTAEERANKAEQRLSITIPEYYLIGKDGVIISRSGSDKYGLFVKREDNKFEKEGTQQNVITYLLTFKKSPPHIPDVTTQEGAIPNVKQVDANIYEAQFLINVGGYLGSSKTIECNFKVTVD